MLTKEQINAIKMMYPFLPMDFCMVSDSTMKDHEFRLVFVNLHAGRKMEISNAMPTCALEQPCLYDSKYPTAEEIEATQWCGPSTESLYCVWSWVEWREEDMELQKKMCRLFVSPHSSTNKRG